MLIGLLALAQGAGGVWLISFGGSVYYLIAAVLMLIGAAFLWQGRQRTRLVFHLLLLGTLAWAFWETQGEAWGLLARLGFVAGMWLFVLMATRGPGRGIPVRVVACLAGLVGLAGSGLLVDHLIAQENPAAAPTAPMTATEQDWPVYGRTQSATRFSPLTQITPANVGKLEVAWTYRTGDMPRAGDHGHEFTFEATPLKIGDTLYLCSPHNIVIALDAETGKERWRFDPKVQDAAAYMRACRGVAYVKADKPVEDCPERILAGTIDGRMIAVDAHTGAPCKSFGTNGQISILRGLEYPLPGFAYTTSPPMVVGSVAVVGGWVSDDVSVGEPSGAIRAFDVISGKFAWAWDMGRPGDSKEPPPGETFTKGSPNSWPPMSVDPVLGLIYLPMGNATPDFWGAHRSPIFEKYSSSIVALDVTSGQPRWSYQTVHHDIWDYDVPANPILFDLKRDGRSIPALAQVTKMGQIFVLDRRTGELLTPAPETPAPQGPAPGDWLSPTQPISTVPYLGPPKLTEAAMWGLTPFDQIACRIAFRRYRYDGLYTPQSVGGSIIYPGVFGVVDWGAATFDEDRGLLIANSSWMPWISILVPRDITDRILAKAAAAGSDPISVGISPQLGTPFGMTGWPMFSPLGIPCVAPPWGHLVAIDLAANKVVWKVTLGTARDNGPLGSQIGLPLQIGVPSMGGPTSTRGGVTFIGAALDNYLRAFDSGTGQELWRGRLPAGGQSSPMTYWSTASGRQFVVISAGGHSALLTKPGDYVVAYALPATAAPAKP
ncbi:MAG: membrane-bound PQQ-dependent dehydrogenase, glucose/quinate/shikimate family [Rhodospirillaceae bacterium]|nr:MAG: membrane-bound PQQ-dependent dehydrogenase, glucose/quinate/shikimate family [Rhodospirillaceae bacterium]